MSHVPYKQLNAVDRWARAREFAATASAPRPPDCNARPMAVVFTASAHCSMERDSKDQTGPVTFVQVKRYTASPENG